MDGAREPTVPRTLRTGDGSRAVRSERGAVDRSGKNGARLKRHEVSHREDDGDRLEGEDSAENVARHVAGYVDR
jgi:hypothetical protein